MKSKLINFYLLSFFLISSLPGCTLSKLIKYSRHQQVTVLPNPLEVNGDNVLFEVKAQVPIKMVQKKGIYGIELAYHYGKNNVEPVGRIAFNSGEFVYENKLPTITRQFSFPYAPEKNSGKLMLQGVATNEKRQEKRSDWQELATGIVTTSKLVARNHEISYALEEFSPDQENYNTLIFYFDKGSAALRNFLGTNVSVLDEFIQANYKTETVQITAGTSPEKEEMQKPRLAAQRAQTLQKFYKQKLEVNDFTNTPQSIDFDNITLKANWEKFLEKVQNSALSTSDIEKIRAIVNEGGTVAEIEEKLQQLEAYEYLQNFVYPILRFAEVKIAYNPLQRKDYEIFLLAKKVIENQAESETLSPQELRYAATLTPLLHEKRKIYEAAIRNNGQWQSFHNLGVVYLQMAKQDYRPQAKNELLKKSAQNLIYASHRNPTALTFYHAAAAHHLRGNSLEALQAYDYAVKLGGTKEMLEKVFSDKAALEIEIGQIDDAVYSLGYAGTSYQNYINKGLVYMLKENYEQATKFYEAALKLIPDDALAHYSLAIIAARTKDENILAYHLKKAVQADKAFVPRAIQDLEFKTYAKKSFFEAALKR